MTSLVNSLVDADHPLNEHEIFEIDIEAVVKNIQDLGVTRIPVEEIERIVIMTVECLKAQLVSDEEANVIAEEVDRALATAAQQSALVLPPEQRVSVSHLDTSRSRQTSRSSKSNLEERRSRIISIVDDSSLKAGGWGKIPEEATVTSKTTTSLPQAGEGSKQKTTPSGSKERLAAMDSKERSVMAASGSKTGITSEGSKPSLSRVGSKTGTASDSSKSRVVGSRSGTARDGSKTRVSGKGSKPRVTRAASIVTTTEQVSQIGEGSRRVSRTTSKTTTVTEYETAPDDISGTTDLDAISTDDDVDSL
ncbi:hypothetical protein O0L34_g11377 [Tuta absoluta]|nr:hypothetical protein O0L34_g11377 [Tuta absoluta]